MVKINHAVVYIYFFLSFTLFLQADESLKTSIIIPCYHKHAAFLPHLLDELSQQTMLPDEVVISISEVDLVPGKLMQLLKTDEYPFDLVILETKERKWCGQNRNLACSQATGDIIICQDADDIPHHQKVEIISYYFKNSDAVHILHRWYPSNEIKSKWNRQQLNQLDFDYPEYYYVPEDISSCSINQFYDIFSFSFISTGYASFRRELFNTVQWPDIPHSEDYKFTRDVINQFHKTLYLNAPLLIYHQENSSTILGP